MLFSADVLYCVIRAYRLSVDDLDELLGAASFCSLEYLAMAERSADSDGAVAICLASSVSICSVQQNIEEYKMCWTPL
jgi:hypothetical protein